MITNRFPLNQEICWQILSQEVTLPTKDLLASMKKPSPCVKVDILMSPTSSVLNRELLWVRLQECSRWQPEMIPKLLNIVERPSQRYCISGVLLGVSSVCPFHRRATCDPLELHCFWGKGKAIKSEVLGSCEVNLHSYPCLLSPAVNSDRKNKITVASGWNEFLPQSVWALR